MGEGSESREVVSLSTPSEAALDTAAAVSNMVPLLGGAISNVLSGLSNDRKLQRVNEVLWAMSEDIRALSEDSEKYVTTDDFKDLLDETLHKVYEERNEEKRRLYKEFLVDEIREPWRSWEDQHRFLRTLEAVQPAHIVVLRGLLALTTHDAEGRAIDRGIAAPTLEDRLPEMDRATLEELVDELISLGLVRNQGLETFDANFSAMLTRYGARFISYIAGKDIVFADGATARVGTLGRRFALVDQEFIAAPDPAEGLAQMVMLARPLGADERLLERAVKEANPAIWFETVVRHVSGALPFNEPNFLDEVADRGLFRRRVGTWVATTDVEGSSSAGSVKYLRIDDDGALHLFFDRVGSRREQGGAVLVFEGAIAAAATHFCATAGEIYSEAEFNGPVIVGVGVRGLLGSESWALSQGLRGTYPLEEAVYTKETRTDAKALRDEPLQVARVLVSPLLEALTQRRFDPFAGRASSGGASTTVYGSAGEKPVPPRDRRH